MTAMCVSCSAWMLSLLLHLLICFHQSSSVPTVPPLHEFNIKVNKLGEIVENQRCQCFNVSVSQEKCSFPSYFIDGLNFLRPKVLESKKQNTINDLIFMLGEMELSFQKSVSFCSSSVKTKALVSPKCLHRKLEFLKQQMNSDPYIIAQQSLPTVDCEVLQ
ncbi:hypothetical protein EXN66_Car009204 [Channa argus]|uniref:Uncharacterized protein n=1 Tax=Channa argus TaxID=215402 RepID=A0A6G1PU69_CHAAH|nr:hypothetical protein EXN66_Car009204 [Channa argus]